MVLQPDTLIRGKYRIVRLIGDGGMGAVYEAQHLILKVPVALKFLHAELAERPGLAERFLREARVSASIQSPHVTHVTDVDTTDAGTPFLVMELLRGESLQEVLNRERQLPIATAIDYTLQILSGLEAAHALNVVHRDLKPDNVFVLPTAGGPLLKLIDFGIAKIRNSEEFKQTLTHAGSMMGTPEYMAPEQLYSAETVDARADLFSLGVMLYEMLSGERPAEGDDANVIIARFVAGNIVPLEQRLPSAPEGLAQAVRKALAPRREERFDSAFAMRVALVPFASALSHAGQLAATPAPLPLDGSPGVDELDPMTRRTSVADTLPPDDGKTTADDPVLTERGGTQDAPNLGAPARGHASAMAPPASPAAQRAGAEFTVRAAPLPSTDPGSRGRRRTTSALIATLIVLLVMIAGAMVALIVLGRGPDEPTQNPLPLDATPQTTIEPLDQPAVPPTSDEPSPTPPPAPPPQTPTPGPVSPRPTPSATSTPDAGPTLPFPSSLPPFPSSLPPLPSGFPTALPSFLPPIPGFNPPRAEKAEDAGP